VFQLARFLYPLPDHRRTPLSLLKWWESRRPAFNLIVGGTGLVTLFAAQLLLWLPPGSSPFHLREVPMLVLVYALLANVCYSGGWLTELVLERFMGDDAPPAGPSLLRVGVTVSIGITLFPIALAGLDWAFRLIRHFF